MTRRSVAFCRALNVGGRRVKSDELVAVFEGCGLDEVATFLASGNILFSDPDGRHPRQLAALLAERLETALGYDVPTTVRSAARLDALAAAEAFDPAAVAAAAGTPQVMLLIDEPGPDALAAALDLATPEDRLAVAAGDLFWLPASGVGRATLDTSTVEALVGRLTVRTINTIHRLLPKL